MDYEQMVRDAMKDICKDPEKVSPKELALILKNLLALAHVPSIADLPDALKP